MRRRLRTPRFWRRGLLTLAAAGLVLLTAGALKAAIVPVAENDEGARALADAMSAGANVTGASFVTSPANVEFRAHGLADAPLNAFPTNGSTFAILTTGRADEADQPTAGASTGLGGGQIRGDTDYDVTVMQVNVLVPEGANCLRFDFKFLSEEYPDYVNTDFNDAFIAELDKSTWLTSGSAINAPDNFAFDPSGDVISINSSGVTAMSAGEAAGTPYGGATPLLSAATQVTAGAHVLYLSIFDQGDSALDSAVFLDNLVVTSVANPATECTKGATRFRLDLTPDTATSTVGSGHTVTATLTDEGAPRPDAAIKFTVTGANAAGGTTSTNSEGKASFTYTGTNPGDDAINACYDANADAKCDAGASATKTWTPVPGVSPDLVVTKTADKDVVTVGDNITYTIAVTNVGTGAATGVSASDALPDGVTFVSVSNDLCIKEVNTVTCALGVLAAGESRTFTIVGKTTATGTPTNTANVSMDQADPTPSSNSDGATVTVNATTPTPPPAGSFASDTSWQVYAVDPASPGATPLGPAQRVCLNASNPPNCPSGATIYGYPFGPAWVADLTPIPGASWIWAPGITGASSPANDAQYYFVHTIELAGSPATGTAYMAVDNFAELRINGTVVGTWDNHGSLTSFDIASYLHSGTNTIVVRAQNGPFTCAGTCTYVENPAGVVFGGSITTGAAPGVADLAVSKSDSPDPVEVGQTLTYTITVTNQGDAPAENVVVQDVLPAGMTLQTVVASSGDCSTIETLACSLGTLNAGASATVTIQVTPAAAGSFDNTATAQTTSTESNALNNSDSENTTVEVAVPTTGLGLSLTPSAATNTVGTAHTVTAHLTDNGADKQGATIHFTVTGANAQAGTDVTNADGRATFAYTGTNSGNDTITACYDADSNATCGNAGDPTAFASKTWTAVEAPPPPAGEGTADLAVTKTAPALVVNGAGFSYSVTVTNAGPDAATGVVLTDKLPSGVAFSSASASQGSCSGGSTVSCSLGTLTAKSSATATIGVTATAPGFVTNEAKVAGAQADPNPGDNSASATTRISPRIDLGIRGTVSPEAVQPGGELTYHIVVTNGGPDTAEGTLVPLTIPSGATLVSVTPSQGICIRDGSIPCFLGRIAAGGSATIDLVLRAGASGDFALPLSVSSDGGTDSNSGNNAASLVGAVAQPYDLRLEMSATPDRIGNGDWIKYTIRATNLGPGPATGVRVVDQLPDTVSFVSCQTTRGECTSIGFLAVTARTVEARLGRLDSGDAGTVTILGRATAPGSATNSASVSGAGEDASMSGNNQSSSSTPVARNQFQPPADVPPPVLNESVDAAPVSGTVKFRRPGSNAFEILTAGEQLPLGTEFDTTNGTMTLTSAADATGAVQTAQFWAGFFVVTQQVTAKLAVTDLALTRGDFSVCKSGRRLAAAGAKPPRGKPPKGRKSTTTRQLWGRGKGHFRTKGKYSSAAVRGTYWLTADRCDGTFTSVREGTVTVRDFVRRRSIVVRAGQSYLARPR